MTAKRINKLLRNGHKVFYVSMSPFRCRQPLQVYDAKYQKGFHWVDIKSTPESEALWCAYSPREDKFRMFL